MNNLSRELAVIYQELVLNEFALMRSRELLLEGIASRSGIYYFSSSNTLVEKSNPLRSFDLPALTYALINGIRRVFSSNTSSNPCYYDIEKPRIWPGQCNIIELLAKLYNKLRLQIPSTQNKYEKLINMIAGLIEYFIDNGLLRVILADQVKLKNIIRESPYYLKWFREFQNTKNAKIQEINGSKEYKIEELIDLKNAYTLYNYFKYVFKSAGLKNVDPYTFFKELENSLKEKLGVNRINENIIILFKTAHGDLARLVYDSRPLPNTFTNYEGKILPFLVEPHPLDTCSENINILKPRIRDFLEKYSGIEPSKASKFSEIIVEALKASGYNRISCYQISYLNELFKNKAYDKGVKVILTAPTGAGKTLVFLVYTITLIIAEKLKKTRARALFIYPRKALASDQLAKFITVIYSLNRILKREFGDQAHKYVISIGIRDNDSLDKRNIPEQELRGITITVKDSQHGELKLKLMHKVDSSNRYVVILRDQNGSISEQLDYVRDHKEWIGDKTVYACDIVVTNHSMFNKHLIDMFSNKTSLREFRDFIQNLKIIVIDEAHIYLESDKGGLLQSAFIKMYYYKHLSSNKPFETIYNDLDIIISSATITGKELFPENIDTTQIIGIYAIPKPSTSNTSVLPSEVREFFETLTAKPSNIQLTNIIYFDYYLTSIRDSSIYNVIKKYYDKPFKIRLVETVIPFPYRSSWTSFNESLVAILHWIHGLRTKLDIPYNVLAFSDSRSSLRDFMKAFNRRQIWEAEDHYDRVLLTPCSPRVEQGDKQRIKAQKTISEFIIAKYHKRTLLEAIYDNGEVEYLTRFHALTNYLDTKRFRDLTRHRISDNENFKEILEKVFGDVIDFCGKVKRYSELVSKYRYESLKLFEKVEKTPTIKPYYVVHHGKLDYDVRRKIEYLARRAEKGDSPSPYVIAATSTLEVGVDLPYVIAVLQYGTDALSPEIQQRIGRSGRSLNTFYISMGIIIFRNTGQDLFYYGDREIVSYVYSIKPRKLHAITRNEHLLAKYLTNFVEILDTSSCKIEDLAEKISQSYGLDMERLREDLEDWEKIAKSIDVEWSRLCEKQDWRNELRDLKYKLEKVSEDLRDIVRRSKSYSELRMMLEEPRRDVESMLNALREILSTGQNAISVSELVSILVKLSIMYRYIDALRREFSEYCKTYQVEEDLIKDIRSSMRDARVYLRDLIKNLLKELICSLEELFSENPCSSDERLREEFHGVLKWFAKNLVFPGIVDPVSARSLKYLLIKASLNRRNRCREYEKTSDYTELTQQAKPLHTGETR